MAVPYGMSVAEAQAIRNILIQQGNPNPSMSNIANYAARDRMYENSQFGGAFRQGETYNQAYTREHGHAPAPASSWARVAPRNTSTSGNTSTSSTTSSKSKGKSRNTAGTKTKGGAMPQGTPASGNGGLFHTTATLKQGPQKFNKSTVPLLGQIAKSSSNVSRSAGVSIALTGKKGGAYKKRKTRKTRK
jgi:hypothetical protein